MDEHKTDLLAEELRVMVVRWLERPGEWKRSSKKISFIEC